MENYNQLKERGYVYQTTDENAVKDMLDNQKVTFYLGIDPTADSLHIGHFVALTLVRRLQKMGHKAIILVGGATALVGDPSGKKDLRKVLTEEQVTHNKQEVKELVKKFVDTEGDNPAIIVDNADWMTETYIDFLRRVGIHFNVNSMLDTDCYKNRLEEGGLTFLEMGYMLIQANDFVHLNDTYGCQLEVGGSDQWANMVAGVTLSKKLDLLDNKNRNLQALTVPLLLKADGEKMGKTAKGALWISKDRTSVYDFYQMFINSYDEDVEKLLCFFSDYSVEEIKKMCKEDIIKAKETMAYEVTKLVHGEEEAIQARDASREIFANRQNSSNMPSIVIDKSVVENGVNILDLLVQTELVSSKSEGRRLIEQGGICVNRERISDTNLIIDSSFIKEDSIILQKGKKIFLRVTF
ncbi:tyrosine--tRNA ligase [bacterium]|nr:tyrosine--tRNA ligase [bacterium]